MLIVCAILSSPKIIYAYYIILLKRLQAKKDTALAEIVLLVLVVKLDNTLIPSTKEETEQTISELISLLEKGTDNPEGSLNFLRV